jgi:hypothetical protein
MTIHRGKHTNEANCQANLANLLIAEGFCVELEFVPDGYTDCRFDVAIFNPKGRLVGVVECKNMKSYVSCIKRESDLQRDLQGKKYIALSKKENFKMFWCGGDARVKECAKEVSRAFPWYVRIWWMIFG